MVVSSWRGPDGFGEGRLKCKNEPKTGDTTGLIFHIGGKNEALEAKIIRERKIQIEIRTVEELSSGVHPNLQDRMLKVDLQ